MARDTKKDHTVSEDKDAFPCLSQSAFQSTKKAPLNRKHGGYGASPLQTQPIL